MAKENICGFDGWVFDFNPPDAKDTDKVKNNKDIQNGVKEVHKHFEERVKTGRTQHLFVFVHGVNTDFGTYRDKSGTAPGYIEWFSRLYHHYVEEQYVRDEPPVRREDITILGVNWPSQEMAAMLKLLLSFDKEKMPAQILAEGGLQDAIHKMTEKYRAKVRVHLTGHSMGAQVLLYLLPKLAGEVEIGSMMFLQGFAPSSAFGGPVADRKTAFQEGIRNTLYAQTQTWLYGRPQNFTVTIDATQITKKVLEITNPVNVAEAITKAIFGTGLSPAVKLALSALDPLALGRSISTALVSILPSRTMTIDVDQPVKNIVGPKVNFLTENIIKVTPFAEHLSQVKGPILATTTGTLWADYQVGIAEISFYSPPGVLGVRGFEGEKVQNYKVHDVDDDEIEGGRLSYDFTEKKRFFNLRADPYYITDHDDIKNRAIVYAHLRAAGVIDKSVVERARSHRYADPAVPAVQNAARGNDKKALNPETWMQETWALIGERKLTQVCMPGSHDSGMGVITHVLAPSEDLVMKLVSGYVEEKAKAFTEGDLTKLLTSGTIDHVTRTALDTARSMMPGLCLTQTSLIREQLRQGCRFFDLRPAWWKGEEQKEAGFYLAHGDFQSFPRQGRESANLGYIGGIGESLEAALEAVASFASEKRHSSELIVLKFSHAADWANPNSAFTQKEALFKKIRSLLGAVMINLAVPPSGHIDDIRLKDLVKGGRTVLCIYEQALYDKSLNSEDPKGVYWCPGDTPADIPQINCRLYDKYADSRNLAGVIGDQWCKFKEQMEDRRKDKASDGVFLLSWTATLKPGPGIMDMRSVLDNAQALNKKLHLSMKNWIRRGDIAGAARPNVLYVDAYDATVLETVAMINAVKL